MSKFEYFHVFETILYGLMLAKLIIGVNNLYTFRSSIKFYWPHFLALLYIFLAIVNSYHDNLDSSVYSAVEDEWFFLHVIIIPPLILYSIIHHALPSEFKGSDLKGLLLNKNRRIIFFLGTAYGILSIYRLMLQWSIEKESSALSIYFKTWNDAWFIIPHTLTLMFLIVAIRKSEILLKILLVLAVLSQVLFYVI